MNKAPDGAVLGEGILRRRGKPQSAGGPEIEAREHGGAGAVGGAGARPRRNRTPERPRRPHAPENPDPIHELIAALREATLGPLHPGRHGLDPPQIIGPESKFNPQFLKEYQVKDLMRIC